MAPPDRHFRSRAQPVDPPRAPGTDLRGLLRTIDGGPFQDYRKILGTHELGDFRLAVLSVPPDALGGPAHLRLSIDRTRAGLTGAWSRGEVARLVLEDAIVRAAVRALDELSGPHPGIGSRFGARVGRAAGAGARVADHRERGRRPRRAGALVRPSRLATTGPWAAGRLDPVRSPSPSRDGGAPVSAATCGRGAPAGRSASHVGTAPPARSRGEGWRASCPSPHSPAGRSRRKQPCRSRRRVDRSPASPSRRGSPFSSRAACPARVRGCGR